MGIIDSLKKKSTSGSGKKTTASKKRVVSAAEKNDSDMSKSQDASVEAVKSVRVSRFSKVLIHPVVSEKSAHAEANNAYTFIIDKNTTKYAVKEAVKDIYGIKPISVRVINTQGKASRMGRRSDVKKAIITLPKGQTIRIHEGV